jgi:hypothetical protein
LFAVIRHLKKELIFLCRTPSDILDSDNIGTVISSWYFTK